MFYLLRYVKKKMLLLTLVVAFASAFIMNTIEQNRIHKDFLYSNVDLKPVSRVALLNYTVTDPDNMFISSTVGDIYVGVLKSASLGNKGYNHLFNPPAAFAIKRHLPAITDKLHKLFPDCNVEYNGRVQMIGVYWY